MVDVGFLVEERDLIEKGIMTLSRAVRAGLQFRPEERDLIEKGIMTEGPGAA